MVSEKERVALSIRLTPELHKWLKEEADRLGMSLNSFASFALNQYKDKYMDGKK